MKYLLLLPFLLLAAVLAAVLRALLTPRKKADYSPAPDPEREREYAGLLSRMVQCETVSHRDEAELAKFRRFHALLEELFPLVHARTEKVEIDGNLLFFWTGRRHDRPLVLMSHQDVVPAEGEWLHPPFSGEIADGKVWGRGASDTKCSLFAFFRAAEELLASGFQPEQDVILASSCTEEFGGDGAPKLVAELRRRGIVPFLVCDEGGGIIGEPVGGIPGRFAMVGVFEKGQANVRFTARSAGGHASAPTKNNPLARLSGFIQRMEKHPPFRKKLEPEVAAMFRAMAPYASFPLRLLLGNLWLFAPLLKLAMPMVSAQAAAMLRTTMVFTMAEGAAACNVIPAAASVSANLRFIPHQGMEESLSLVKKEAKRFGLETEILSASDYTAPVDIRGSAWQMVAETIAQVFPGVPVSPYVMTGGTDARFYQELCPSCVRFAPVIYDPEQMKGMHGLNENISSACLPGAVDYYKALIRRNL